MTQPSAYKDLETKMQVEFLTVSQIWKAFRCSQSVLTLSRAANHFFDQLLFFSKANVLQISIDIAPKSEVKSKHFVKYW